MPGFLFQLLVVLELLVQQLLLFQRFEDLDVFFGLNGKALVTLGFQIQRLDAQLCRLAVLSPGESALQLLEEICALITFFWFRKT